jgi:CRISPR system Cascade subunit CasC
MTDTLFLQIHTLTNYHAALLNRDDAGFAKRIPIGGAVRTRVSSQCLKRHWRQFNGEHALYDIDQMDEQRSIRSRHTFARYIVEPLLQEGLPVALVEDATRRFMGAVLGSKDDNKEAEKGIRTAQVTVLGEPEIRYLRAQVWDFLQSLRDLQQLQPLWAGDTEQLDKKIPEILEKEFKFFLKNSDMKKNLKGLRLASGLDAAMFGRMVTSDYLARGDAAIHVAHAFTVHEEASESDYFSAVDDLLAADAEGELGSGHINSAELNSGLYYSYVVVDVPLLISNLEGCDRAQWRNADRALAAEVTRRLIHLIATVSPGAKLGSTAPYNYAQAVLVEAGRSQPRTLADAFLRPVASRGDLMTQTYEALAREIAAFRAMYGWSSAVALASRLQVSPLNQVLEVQTRPLADVARWAMAQVRDDKEA